MPYTNTIVLQQRQLTFCLCIQLLLMYTLLCHIEGITVMCPDHSTMTLCLPQYTAKLYTLPQHSSNVLHLHMQLVQ